MIAAIVAPLAALVATTSTAGAAPVNLRVSGDAGTVNGGNWVWGGSMYDELKGLLASTDFGADVDFTVDTDGTTPSQLAAEGVDIFLGGAVPGGYSGPEEDALEAWIQAGGVYIAMGNAQAYDIMRFLPGAPAIINPPAVWEPGTHACDDNTPSFTDCFIEYVAPTAATAVNASNPAVSPLLNGSHGTVTSIRNFHTVGVFTALPTGAVEAIHLTNVCTPGTSVACADQNVDPDARTYNNNIDGPNVAVVPFGTSGYGTGAVVVMADGDVFASNYSAMPTGNRTLALNTFQWIGNHFAAQADSTPTEKFVDATYVTLLSRSADTAGLAYWSERLDSGALSRGQFTFALANSNEWRAKVINDFYAEYLGRSVDAGGLTYWNGLLAGGMRVSDMAKNIFASEEYFVNSGNTVQAWVESLYTAILNRASDPAGVNYWVNEVNSGAPRAAAANAFFLSYESNVRRVDALYADILNRAPDAGGRDYWGKQLVTLDDIALASLLVSSDEFYSQVQAGLLPVA